MKFPAGPGYLILLKNPMNASTRLSMNGKSPMISTAPPFVLRLSKDERRVFRRINILTIRAISIARCFSNHEETSTFGEFSKRRTRTIAVQGSFARFYDMELIARLLDLRTQSRDEKVL